MEVLTLIFCIAIVIIFNDTNNEKSDYWIKIFKNRLSYCLKKSQLTISLHNFFETIFI